jgi:hypothetical protein
LLPFQGAPFGKIVVKAHCPAACVVADLMDRAARANPTNSFVSVYDAVNLEIVAALAL